MFSICGDAKFPCFRKRLWWHCPMILFAETQDFASLQIEDDCNLMAPYTELTLF